MSALRVPGPDGRVRLVVIDDGAHVVRRVPVVTGRPTTARGARTAGQAPEAEGATCGLRARHGPRGGPVRAHGRAPQRVSVAGMDGCQGSPDEATVSVTVVRGYAWAAGEDGIAHATPTRGRHVRALCGVLALDHRWARTIVLRCPDCMEVMTARSTADRTTTRGHDERTAYR